MVERYEISPAKITYLAEMAAMPTLYTQRCVEHLQLSPAGGQKWTRRLQILLPDQLNGSESTTGSSLSETYAVSLGMFERRRYPDLTVADCQGRQLNLLTRQQHGTILTRVFLTTYLQEFEQSLDDSRAMSIPKYSQIFSEFLYAKVYNLVTGIHYPDHPGEVARGVSQALLVYLRSSGIKIEPDDRRLTVFEQAMAGLETVTQYLCWVTGRPGETVQLQVTYSTKDKTNALDYWRKDKDRHKKHRALAKRELAQRLTEASRMKQAGQTVSSPKKEMEVPGWGATRLRWYRQLGLAPLNYALLVPDDQHAKSYYFMLEPPPNTSVTRIVGLLDEDEETKAEVDCGYAAFHRHNKADPKHSPFRKIASGGGNRPATPKAAETESARAGTIYAYLRTDLRDHKAITAGAIINLAFVYCVSRGRLINGSGLDAQAWLLLTPTLLMGFITQRQRHYYALATRRQRGLLWWYLAMSAVFLVAVAFSKAHDRGIWGPVATGTFVAFALFSSLIAVLYFPMGYLFQTVTKRRAKKREGKLRGKEIKRRAYDKAVQRYCDYIALGAMLVLLAVGGVAVYFVTNGYVEAGKVPTSKPRTFNLTINVRIPAAGTLAKHPAPRHPR